jgi:hypothetical protein
MLRFGAHARYAIHQASRCVLEIVALLHNLIFSSRRYSLRSSRYFDSDANTFRQPRSHSLRHAQDAGFQRVIYARQVEAKTPVHLNKPASVRLIPAIGRRVN